MQIGIKASFAVRLQRIEDQVRGMARMVDEDGYCIDIVTQVSAVRATLHRLEEEILQDHVAHCVPSLLAPRRTSARRSMS
jgi:DNA-binding FrmR family transcriptional regulator